MRTIDQILKEIKELDLSTLPVDLINQLFNEFGIFGNITYTLHPRKRVYRARTNNKNEIFKKVSDLSFLPSGLNSEYKRASTPTSTMFYGAILAEDIKEGEITDNRIAGCFECVDFLRDLTKKIDGENKVTFGTWIVTKDIPLIAIVFDKDLVNKSSYFTEMSEGFTKFISEYPDLKDKTEKIYNYLASEFSKKQIDNGYDYLISSLFTKRVIDKGLKGVLYPSVRSDGAGYNVAIHPDAVKTSMKMVAAGECTVYKKGDQVIVDNETLAYLKDNDTEFELKPVDSQYHLGKEKVYEKLNK
ncbi:MAG: RES family NAD+ phosphorylase [Salinivirgaceae bacterium]|nr:RES family NAD+ phosphorylase [Salinivirgaceae bacterium]